METKTFDYGQISGPFSSYYINGQKLSEEPEAISSDGDMIKNGKWLFWNQDGLLIEEIEFSNGIQEMV